MDPRLPRSRTRLIPFKNIFGRQTTPPSKIPPSDKQVFLSNVERRVRASKRTDNEGIAFFLTKGVERRGWAEKNWRRREVLTIESNGHGEKDVGKEKSM